MSTLAEIEAAVEALDEKEQVELLRHLNARVRRRKPQSVQFMDLAGTIHLREDPLEVQMRMRDEWQ